MRPGHDRPPIERARRPPGAFSLRSSVPRPATGRGAVLTAVARRLTSGRAVGIDIWRAVDQAGNAKAVTERNVALEGVADRVEIETGDMRGLRFPDASFDLVVSSLAIHNIRGNADRQKANRRGLPRPETGRTICRG